MDPLTDQEIDAETGTLAMLFHKGCIDLETYYVSAFLMIDRLKHRKAQE